MLFLILNLFTAEEKNLIYKPNKAFNQIDLRLGSTDKRRNVRCFFTLKHSFNSALFVTFLVPITKPTKPGK